MFVGVFGELPPDVSHFLQNLSLLLSLCLLGKADAILSKLRYWVDVFIPIQPISHCELSDRMRVMHGGTRLQLRCGEAELKKLSATARAEVTSLN